MTASVFARVSERLTSQRERENGVQHREEATAPGSSHPAVGAV
jgi:hypothetical protein